MKTCATCYTLSGRSLAMSQSMGELALVLSRTSAAPMQEISTTMVVKESIYNRFQQVRR